MLSTTHSLRAHIQTLVYALIVGVSLLLALPATAAAATYYVSATGNDSNNGTSQSTAWRTVGKLSTVTFSAGDQILFRGGDSFTPLYFGAGGIQSNATANNPLTVGSYGTGRATIVSTNNTDAGIYTYNKGALTLKDLIVTGNGAAGNTAAGIYLYTDTNGNSGITIDNVDVSGFSAGIVIGSWNGTNGFSNITVSNSTVHDNKRNGIQTYGQSRFSHQNLTIRNNEIYNITGVSGVHDPVGNCIILGQVDGATVEHNICHDSGQLDDTDYGPVGIWAYESNAIVIQYNEVYNFKTSSSDGGGFDFDGGVTNSIMQYNYSHDNEGAGYLLFHYDGAGAWGNNIVRYNISENDGANSGYAALTIGTESDLLDGFYVYNNTFYNDQGASNLISFLVSSNVNGVIANNILYSENGAKLIETHGLNPSAVAFRNNNYYTTGPFSIAWNNNAYSSLSAWSNATGQEKIGGATVGVSTNPLLTNAGAGGTQNGYNPSGLAAYTLQSSSPMIDAGLNLPSQYGINVGATDYYGQTNLGGAAYDIGAYEDQSNGSGTTPPPPTPTTTPPATELLTNGSFESQFTGWTDWGNSHVVSTHPTDGSYELLISGGAGGAGQDIMSYLTPGDTYTVTLDGTMTGSEWFGVGLDLKNSGGTTIENPYVTVTSSSYQQTGFTFTVPATASAAVLWLWKDAGSGYGYIDNIVITNDSNPAPDPEPEPEPNTDPETVFWDDFESSLSWTVYNLVNWSTSNPKNGTHSARLRRQGVMDKSISLAGYQNATVWFEMGASSLDNNNEYVAAYYHDGSDWVEMARISNGSAEENGQLHSFSYELPAETDDLSDFQLRFWINGSGSGDYGYIDDVAILAEPIQ